MTLGYQILAGSGAKTEIDTLPANVELSMGTKVVEISAFFQRLADDFAAARFRTFTEKSVYPLIVYGTQGIRIEKHPGDTVSVLSRHHDAMMLSGARRVVSTVTTPSSVSEERFPLRVRWRFLKEDGREAATSEYMHFCTHGGPHGLMIEMLEVVEVGLETPSPSASPSRH
ncbi:MAG: hypothetical protein QNJ35_06575 [Paracoccaceae bacterium]|nr:hypothetical protein [Paracoccaceae bacterium]